MFSIRSILRPSSSSSVVVLHSSFYSSSSSSSSAAAIQAERTILQGPRNDWSRDEIRAVYDSPVLDLLFHGVSTSLCFLSQKFGETKIKTTRPCAVYIATSSAQFRLAFYICTHSEIFFNSFGFLFVRYIVVTFIFRLKFTDVHITLGKCNSVRFSLSRLVGVVRIAHIVLNPLGMTQD